MSSSTGAKLYGGIEAGGTKFVCAVGTGPDDIRDEERFATTRPEETIAQAIAFFRRHQTVNEIAALGIASFGPLDPDPKSPTYGYITTTPKPGWAQTDLAGTIGRALNIPVGFDTDVNGAAIGEWRWGAGKGLNTIVYFTIGTGVGGGALVNGRLLHGLIHPEMGHVPLPHDLTLDPYKGRCPFHGDCFEGLAAGPAVGDRWGVPAEQLAPDHPAWDLEAHYIAVALSGFIYTLSPQRIIMGGGIMQQSHIFPLVRQKLLAQLNGYVQSPSILLDINNYVVPPALGNHAGVLGAFALAEQALSDA